MQEQNNLFERYDIESFAQGHQPPHFSLASLSALENTEDTHFWSKVKRFLVLLLIRTFRPSRPFDLMDIGCGNGSLLRTIQAKFPDAQCMGMDAYLEALIATRLRAPAARLFFHDIAGPAFPKQAFLDVITILDVLEHLDHPERTVESMRTMLRETGIVIASVPASRRLWSDRDRFLGHRKRYSKRDLRDLFEEHGFEILQCNYCYSYLWLPVFLFRKVLSRWTKTPGQEIEQKELRHIPFVNALLAWFGMLEAWLSLSFPIPFGTSIYCVARRKQVP